MGKFGRNLGAKSPFFYTQIRSSRNVRPTDSTGLSELAIGSIPIARSISLDDSIAPYAAESMKTPYKMVGFGRQLDAVNNQLDAKKCHRSSENVVF